jgi:protein-tyrosine phosphatase
LILNRRTFLAAATALVLPGPAVAAGAMDASATRLADKTRLRVEWTDKTDPVSIFVSNDPNGGPGTARLLKAAKGGVSDVEAPVSPRPYFVLTTKDGTRTWVAERLLPLEGGRNFRDLGGYRADDGRQVRWGRIYRSGVMSGLTASDLDYLGKLGIAVVCDLRNPQERASEPSPFLATHGAQVVTFDYDISNSLNGFGQLKTRDQAIAAFAAAYVGFIDTLAPNYTDMFARLVDGRAPLAMNCSAGKDRTGMGSALVLSVLGVPRQTVVADYALTQVYTPPAQYLRQMAGSGTVPGLSDQQAQVFRRLPPEVLDVMMGSDPEVMRQALAEIDRKFGGPIALAKSRLGLTDAKIAALRGAYLI